MTLHNDSLLQAAETLTSLPFLAVILAISLPVWLPMVIYQRLRGPATRNGE